MKRINFMLLGLAGLVFASCSQDDFGTAVPGTEANVSVALTMPTQMGTRAFSDGTTATKLQYAVYSVTGEGENATRTLLPSYTNTNDEINLAKQVSFRLVNGETYGIVFWASSPSDSAPYTVEFNDDGAKMSVDYTKVKANSEDQDAFCVYKEFTVNGDAQMSAELRRPFAQINIGTNDFEEAKAVNKAPTQSQVYITNVCQTLDLISGEASDPVTNINNGKFQWNQIPENELFPVDGYDYISMVYALVPRDQQLVTLAFQHNVAGASTVRYLYSVPVQRNFRTNIYGQVLTSNADLNVIIVPEYEAPDNALSELIVAAALGKSITLQDDVDLNQMLTYRNTATIDLNGHDIDINPNGEKNGQIYANKSGETLTINGPGTIAQHGTLFDNGTAAIYVNNGATVTINNATVTSEGVEAIFINQGTVNITGGYFAAANPYPENAGKYFTLNCMDANYRNGTAKFVVTGGTFENFDPSNSPADTKDNQNANWVPEGYHVIMTEANGKQLYTVVPDGVEAAATSADELIQALESGEGVVLMDDILIDPAQMSSGYGKTGINVKNGQTIDGNGHTLNINGAGGTWDSGINTLGGIIKNITVTGSFRGIFINHQTGFQGELLPVILENVTIQGTTYTISCDQGMYQTLKATNSTFNGWTSYAATLGSAEFIGCHFGEGNGYKFMRPYAPTTYENCDFCAGYQIDPRAAVSFKNCTLNGVAITQSNLHLLVTSNIANATVK